MTSTFKNVDGSTPKLKDFKVNEACAPLNVKIYFLNENGATKPDAEGREGFIYIHPNMCTTGNKWKTGWYAFKLGGVQIGTAEYQKGEDSDYWANEKEVPYGQGFGVTRMTQTATMVFSGAVSDLQAEIPITTSGKYTWTGNVMPVGYKLKDLSVKEACAPLNVKIYFLNENGATKPDTEGREGFIYIHPNMCTTGNKWKTGWYAFKLGGVQIGTAEYQKGEDSDYWANEKEIPAGQGFGVTRMTQAATLIVPTPLAQAVKAE